jgi:hypothetical protein
VSGEMRKRFPTFIKQETEFSFFNFRKQRFVQNYHFFMKERKMGCFLQAIYKITISIFFVLFRMLLF